MVDSPRMIAPPQSTSLLNENRGTAFYYLRMTNRHAVEVPKLSRPVPTADTSRWWRKSRVTYSMLVPCRYMGSLEPEGQPTVGSVYIHYLNLYLNYGGRH